MSALSAISRFLEFPINLYELLNDHMNLPWIGYKFQPNEIDLIDFALRSVTCNGELYCVYKRCERYIQASLISEAAIN